MNDQIKGVVRVDLRERNFIAERAHMTIEEAVQSLDGKAIAAGDWQKSVMEIAAMARLLGESGIGWDHTAPEGGTEVFTVEGVIFPTLQLRSWIARWRKDDLDALADHQRQLEIGQLRRADAAVGDPDLLKSEALHRIDSANCQDRIALALRIEARILGGDC